MKKVLLLIILFTGLYFSARVLLVWNKPNSDSETQVSINIERGTGLKKISQQLYEAELIRDPLVFQLHVKWNALGNRLQAGEYVIPRNLTFKEITEILQHGKATEIKITIPEGSTIAQIDEILAKKALIKPGVFQECASFCDLDIALDNLEGFLFPSTYFVNPKTFQNKAFIERLYKEFQNQISDLRTDISHSERSMKEIIIVASMVEREAFGDEEMPAIADIIWKRYDEGMYLGIDATTRYEKNDWKNPLYSEDFEKDGPYNTRKRLGLPPTAISNPGLTAIRATVHPKKTPYWYYLHDRNGQIHFAEDLDGHNRNKRQHLN